MRIKDILQRKKRGVSFELFPPKTEKGLLRLEEVAKQLEKYQPLYVSMTYGAGGASQNNTVAAVHLLQEKTKLEVMPHLTCIGAKKSELAELLADYKTRGIENILALRGDAPQNVPGFDPKRGELAHASDLIAFIKSQYPQFCLGCAVYPQLHPESSSSESDIEYAKKKIDLGCDFCATQMFFENKFFYQLRDRLKAKGAAIPVLPGIIPIIDFKQIEKFAALCNATIPSEVADAMQKHLDQPEEMRKIGVEFAVKQCKDLVSHGVNYFHFFTLNRSESVQEVIEACGLQ